jgi:RNA polymerase sigma-70 factor, ECF subfamily
MIGPSFAAVLAAATDGDELAFGVLWRDLQPPLLRYLNAFAPGAGEDLASETWLRVVGALGSFSGDERAFRAWVFTVARHRADDPAGAAVDAISSQAAVARIATLPPDQAEVVLLRVVAGLDVAEVAAITGKRPGNVRVLAHRALRRLAAQLTEDPRVRGPV